IRSQFLKVDGFVAPAGDTIIPSPGSGSLGPGGYSSTPDLSVFFVPQLRRRFAGRIHPACFAMTPRHVSLKQLRQPADVRRHAMVYWTRSSWQGDPSVLHSLPPTASKYFPASRTGYHEDPRRARVVSAFLRPIQPTAM